MNPLWKVTAEHLGGNSQVATCLCGNVELKASGRPIVSAACYCNNCQNAGRRLEGLPGAPPLLESDCSTQILLFPKDRTLCSRGQQFLAEHRLTPETKTRRVVATCCNTALFLDFTKGHWLSMYSRRFPEGERVPVEMRAHSGRFMWRLLSSWAAMGFRTPEINYVNGKINDWKESPK